MCHLNRTQSLSPPCSDQEMITSYVPTPSPCKEDRANESPIQDPITLSAMLRPGNNQYSRVSHRIQFERSYSWSQLGRKSNVSHNKTQSLPPPCFDQEIITSYVPIPSPCKEGRATESSKQDPITLRTVPRPRKINIHELVKEFTRDEFHDLKSLEGGTVYT